MLKKTISLLLVLGLLTALPGCSLLGQGDAPAATSGADLPADDPEADFSSDTRKAQAFTEPAGYATLNADEKKLYDRLMFEIQALEPVTHLNGDAQQDEVNKVFEYILYDHPEFFYLHPKLNLQTNGTSVQKITYTYYMTADEVAQAQDVIDQMVRPIIDELPSIGSDAEQLRYIHDNVIGIARYYTDYDVNKPYDPNGAMKDNEVYRDCSNIYGALVRGEAVCSGYARAFQYIANLAGFYCIRVIGYADNVGHEWNLVKMDDQIYYIDPTYDDPGYADDGGGTSAGTPRENYFMISEDTLLEDHTLPYKTKYGYPILGNTNG